MAEEFPRGKADPATEFERVQNLARRNAWSISGASDQRIALQTDAAVDGVTTAGFEDISHYLGSKHGIRLDICGGGYGCFEIVSNISGLLLSAAAASAIAQDPGFHARLNEHGYDRLLIQGPEGEIGLQAMFPYEGFCFSNRQPVLDCSGSLVDFSDAEAREVSVARIAVEIAVHQHGGRREKLLRRVWRKIKGRHGLLDPTFEIRGPRLELLSPADADPALRAEFLARQGGGLIYVHGVNTTFREAVRQWSGLCHHVNVPMLDLVPIFFSWPAQPGAAAAYVKSVNYAIRSRVELLEALRSISSAAGDRQVSIVAHSHGCRLTTQGLLRSTAGIERNDGEGFHFRNLIYVAPDVDEKEFADDVPPIAGLTDRITVYASSDDEALRLSARIWGKSRTGASGGAQVQIGRRIDLIDVSGVSTGVVGHTYFLDCGEVMEDMFEVLKTSGGVVASRPRRPLDATQGRWRLLPTEAPRIEQRG